MSFWNSTLRTKSILLKHAVGSHVCVVPKSKIRRNWSYFPAHFYGKVINYSVIPPPGLRSGICGHLLAGAAGSILAEGMVVSCDCSVLSTRGHCHGPTTRSEEPHRLWYVWVWPRNLSNEEAQDHQCCKATENINYIDKRNLAYKYKL